MRLITVFTALSVLALSAPAVAQAIAPGTQVTDPNGGAVGTVKAVQGDNLLISTGTHEALLPKASFTAQEGKLYFGLTQAQLNAAIEESTAAADAAVAAGATVKGAQGNEIGKIEVLDRCRRRNRASVGQEDPDRAQGRSWQRGRHGDDRPDRRAGESCNQRRRSRSSGPVKIETVRGGL